ncbi:EAL domain-containing protein [Desulfatitalea alkaliphila]|uniref:EAL domain-containing protein n=1 Tax=Desulfatitalea alkaliphila TaxID=2929485 RepID=A0AA41ULG4_9BACT|nr:EAL domain-containing protein [Desulfatitalea alkaliphila]MCJ8501481.1 EAL domain-containing protein [Desulfatitalea alkaliphila]
MQQNIAQETLITTEALYQALAQDDFTLHFQPKVDLRTGRIGGVEALIRWQHPQLGFLAPGVFLPVAEQAGLMPEIDQWVLRAVCDRIRQWQSDGVPTVPVAVNIGSEYFEQERFVRTLGTLLQHKDIPPHLLELELTESTLMQDPEAAEAIFFKLRTLGVKVAMDDFGTGYSGLAYLRRLPFDTLKIDRSYVQNVSVSPANASIVSAIISLAHTLGLQVVGEGAETWDQVAFLARCGCDTIQGFHYSRPRPPEEIEAMLRGRKRFDVPLSGSCTEEPIILVLDDEVSIVKALQRVLQSGGFRVVGVNSAHEALSLMAAEPAHVVISDHRMPEMLGVDFLDRIKGLYPATVRVLLSGQADMTTLSDAINRRCVDRFIPKPWDRKQLLDEVRQAVQTAVAKRCAAEEAAEGSGATGWALHTGRV